VVHFAALSVSFILSFFFTHLIGGISISQFGTYLTSVYPDTEMGGIFTWYRHIKNVILYCFPTSQNFVVESVITSPIQGRRDAGYLHGPELLRPIIKDNKYIVQGYSCSRAGYHYLLYWVSEAHVINWDMVSRPPDRSYQILHCFAMVFSNTVEIRIW